MHSRSVSSASRLRLDDVRQPIERMVHRTGIQKRQSFSRRRGVRPKPVLRSYHQAGPHWISLDVMALPFLGAKSGECEGFEIPGIRGAENAVSAAITLEGTVLILDESLNHGQTPA
jgi:hypothetical protein